MGATLCWFCCLQAVAGVPPGVDHVDFQILSDLFSWGFNPELPAKRRQQLLNTKRYGFSGRLVLTWSFPGAHPKDPLRPYSERASQIAVAHQALVDADGTYPRGVSRRYRKAMSRANRKLKKRFVRSGELDDEAARFPTLARGVEELRPLLVRKMGHRSPAAILLGLVEPREGEIPFVPEPRFRAGPDASFVRRVWGSEPRRSYLPFVYESGALVLCGNEAFQAAHRTLMQEDADPEDSYREVFERTIRDFRQRLQPRRTRDPVRNHGYTEGLHDLLDAAGIGDRLKTRVLREGRAAEDRDDRHR